VKLGPEDRGLGATGHIEFHEQGRHVVLNRLLGKEQSSPDLTIGQTSTIRSRICRSRSVSEASRGSSVGGWRSRSRSLPVTAESRSDRPAATCRIASVSEEPPISLSRYPAAPAMTAENSASSSSDEVKIKHWVFGNEDRISRHSSIPLPSGRRASRIATSGRAAGMRWSASATVLASPVTERSLVVCSRSAIPRRTISWSSSRKTLIGPAC
jgi:hypothetical protein